MTSHDETAGLKRKKSRRGGFFLLGASWLSSLDWKEAGVHLSTGSYWDLGRFVPRMVFGISYAANAFVLGGGLGANYYLSSKDFSPLLGGDLQLVTSKSHGKDIFSGERAGGIAVGLVGGIAFGRVTEVPMEVSAKIQRVMSSNKFGYPTVYILQMGISTPP